VYHLPIQIARLRGNTVAPEAFPDPASVSTRKEFASFVDRLCADLRDHPDEWENVTLENFLEALSAYVYDVPGYVKNAQSHFAGQL